MIEIDESKLKVARKPEQTKRPTNKVIIKTLNSECATKEVILPYGFRGRKDIYYGVLDGVGRVVVYVFKKNGKFKRSIVPAIAVKELNVEDGEYDFISYANYLIILLDKKKDELKSLALDLSKLKEALPRKGEFRGLAKIIRHNRHSLRIALHKEDVHEVVEGEPRRARILYGNVEGVGRVILVKFIEDGEYLVTRGGYKNYYTITLPQEVRKELNVQVGIYRIEKAPEKITIYLDSKA